ncbi:MAG: GNAT family N-acetyltransferase [Flavobacteriaceae bacterium]|nr:GNAT family N-acetyltransferase [Flavobacteriaceae bacterium]
MEIQFKRLTEVEKEDIIELMNLPLVRRQMPLLKGIFTLEDCDAFVANKEALWAQFGYGPWGFVVNDRFAGWGGIQDEEGEADLALVLHPDFWGMGKTLYKKIIEKAFGELGLESIVVLFPPSRTRVQGLLRLGFKEEQKLMMGNELFIRYRLVNPHKE